MNRFAATPVALLVFVLGLVSCGGDGGGDAPSKAEFATQANKICTATEKQLTNLGKAASTDEIADQIDKVIDAMQKSVDQLKDLDRPDGAAGDTAEKFVNAVDSDIGDKGIPALEDLRDAIKKKDQQAAQKAYRRLQTVETTTSDKLAQEAGVKGCAG